MPIIYIQNLLHPVAVCRALFDAAAKTEQGIAEKKMGMQSLSSIPGVYEPLYDSDIEQELWSSRHNGFLLNIGYLQVKLAFTINSVDVTYYEKTYGISATTILEAAGFTCSDKPISSSFYEPYSPVFTPAISKNKAKPEDKAETDDKVRLYSQKIASDKRFKKSNQHGVLFESSSYSLISDDDLIAYGAKRWDRKKDGIDNIVLILEMENDPKTSQQPKMR